MGWKRVRLSLACLGLMFLGSSCDDSTTLVLEPNPATRVVIDASSCPRVEACATCTLRAEGFDKNGRLAPFPTLVWTSLDPLRATVEQTGRVNGWRGGNVTIHVEVLETGAFDEVTFPVVINPFVPCNPPAAAAGSSLADLDGAAAPPRDP